MHLHAPLWLHSLWLLPILAVAVVHAFRAQRRAVRWFVDHDLNRPLAAGVAWGRRGVKAVLMLATLALLGFALARPQWNRTEQNVTQTGRDVIFIVDVSRSMLARDLAPNRLERSRLWIKDVVANLSGDRVGLIAFAGTPVVKCPLTLDYGFFSLALDGLSPRSVSRGGTNIGDAIRKAVNEVFEDDERHRDVFLITDGEDQDSFPVQAAEQAGQDGVRIIAIGIGSESEGAEVVTDEGETMMHEGIPVRSRLQAGTLAQVAAASAGGVFLNVGTGTIDLDEVYGDLIRRARGTEVDGGVVVEYEEKFQIFLAMALLLLVTEVFIRDRR